MSDALRGYYVTAWEYCWLHWSTAEIVYLTVDGALQQFPAEKDAGAGVARLGLDGWELVNVDGNMWYFKRPLGD